MSRGKYLFPQVMDYYPSWVFDKAVKTYNADYHVRVSSSAMCRYLLFGQLSGCKSLNDISLVLKAHEKHLYQMGFPEGIVDSSSLSRANESRDYRIYEDLGMWLIKKVGPKYAKEHIPDVYLPGWDVFAIDSTTMSCSIKLASWALGKYSKGGVKMHTVLNLRGSIPDQIYITDSRWHDSNYLDVIKPNPWAIYTMDKAYLDFEALYKLHKANCFFVTRAKSSLRYEVVERNYNINEAVGIVGDCVIRLTGYKSKMLYPENLRMAEYLDAESGEVITFITNNMDLGSLVIANIYRNRWQIETFFKWIKQNLTIKALWGYTKNAVQTQLWVAICAYLLLAWIKVDLKSPLSVTEIATIVEVSILSKSDLRELIHAPEPLTINQDVNELTIF